MKRSATHTLTLAAALMLMILTACGSVRHTQRGQQKPQSGLTKPLTSQQQNALVKETKKWIGTRYQYGGHSRKGTDCSGMVMEVYLAVCGIALPRSSREQQAFCQSINKKDLVEGDLIFFCTGSAGRVSHVGMYIGDGKMVHASTSKGVIISRLDERYYQRTYHSSGRVMALASSPAAPKAPKVEKAPKSEKAPEAPKTTNAPAVTTPPSPAVTAPAIELDDLLDAKVDSIYTNMFD